jgi:hypothetical protein
MLTVFIMLLAALAPVTSAHAQDPDPCVVTSALDDYGEGTLRYIIDNTTCETITFAGNYTIVLDSGWGPLRVGRSMTIDGVGHDVTLSGGGLVSVLAIGSGSGSTFNLLNLSVVDGRADFSLDGHCGGGGMMIGMATVNISNVTFSRNQQVGVPTDDPDLQACMGGGGIFNINGNLTLTDVTFDHNSADMSGGGLHSYGQWVNDYHGGSVTLTRVNFRDNTADYAGGGMSSFDDARLTLTDVSFSSNSALGLPGHASGSGLAGGLLIAVLQPAPMNPPTLTNVIFSGNSAARYGGLFVESPGATLTNVIFDGNSALGAQAQDQSTRLAGEGGGMGVYGGSATLTNATFSHNSAADGTSQPGVGGGMIVQYSRATLLTNVTFSGNSASLGGAIEHKASGPSNSNLTLQNSILWGNGDNVIHAGGLDEALTTVSYSDVEGGWAGTGNIDGDPLFVDATNSDLHLQAGSPAIDAGDQTLLPAGVTTDLDGNPRVAGGNVDMGAYEFQSIPADTTPPVVTVTGVSEGATYLLGAVPVAGCSTTDEGSGVATEATLSLSGGNSLGVGSFTATCSGATDTAGNAADPVSVHYNVTFLFTGFSSPVDNPNVMNIAKAGQAIPLKFRITDASGNPIGNLTGVTVTASSLFCSAGTTTDLINEYASGSSGLQNLGDGYYQWNWKTPTSYANSCKTMKLDLGEGLFHTALFQFKK